MDHLLLEHKMRMTEFGPEGGVTRWSMNRSRCAIHTLASERLYVYT